MTTGSTRSALLLKEENELAVQDQVDAFASSVVTVFFLDRHLSATHRRDIFERAFDRWQRGQVTMPRELTDCLELPPDEPESDSQWAQRLMDALLNQALSVAIQWNWDTGPAPERLARRFQSLFREDEARTPASERAERRKHIYQTFCLSAEAPATVREFTYLAFMRRRWPDAQTALLHVLKMQALGAGSEPDDALDSVRFIPVLSAMGLGPSCDVAVASGVFLRSPAPANAQERQARLGEVARLLISEVD